MFSRLFRSRWAVLLWAAGICWTAYEVAGSTAASPSGPAAAAVDATGESVDPAALATLGNASP